MVSPVNEGPGISGIGESIVSARNIADSAVDIHCKAVWRDPSNSLAGKSMQVNLEINQNV